MVLISGFPSWNDRIYFLMFLNKLSIHVSLHYYMFIDKMVYFVLAILIGLLTLNYCPSTIPGLLFDISLKFS